MSDDGIFCQKGGLEMLDNGLITETVRILIFEGSLERHMLLSKGGRNICQIEAHLFPHLYKGRGCSCGTGRAR